MSHKTFNLHVVSQEKELLNTPVQALTAQTSTGEVTILADHIPLFAPLVPCELLYVTEKEKNSMIISQGFLDVSGDNVVTVMVDSAKAARDISLIKAQEAVEAARETLKHSQDKHELLMAEASLKQALLEVKMAQKTKKTSL